MPSAFIKIVFTSFILVGALASSSVFADDSQNSSDQNKTNSTTKKNSSGESVDDLITNNNLRAYSGSVSKWSIASAFNYLGGTVNDPFSQNRPDISQSSGTTTKSDIDGSISVKYNMDVRNSLMVGFGVRWIAPLSPSGPGKDYNGTTYDAMNPYLQYQYIYKWFGIQSVVQVSATQWTQADQTALGYNQNYNIDQENMYEIGETHISVGASVSASYQTFNKSGPFGTPGTVNYIGNLADVQSLYSFYFAPELEYQLNDKWNFRTLVSLWSFEHYKSTQNPNSYVHDKVYQSIGVGYAVTRDVFLYPNIQFIPDDVVASETNVGISATINLF